MYKNNSGIYQLTHAKLLLAACISLSGCGAGSQYSLDVSKSGTGEGGVTSSPAGINCGVSCAASYNNNTKLVLTASALEGSVFVGWSGACSGSASTCEITVTGNNSVGAIFDKAVSNVESDDTLGVPPVDATDAQGSTDENGFRHQYIKGGNDVTFHIVDKGDRANPHKIVFFHGVPDSWYLWQSQMDALASKYHVVALDLKGAGQSGKPLADAFGGTGPGAVNNPLVNGQEMLVAIDNFLGADTKFNVVSEDWGTVFGEAVVYLAGKNRIQSYIRGQAPVNTGNAANTTPYNPANLLDCPNELAAYIEADRSAKDDYVYGIYNSRTYDISTLAASLLTEIQTEFHFSGTYDAWVAYQYGGVPNLETAKSWFATYDFPVLQLEGDSDRAQPPAYFVSATGEFLQANYFPKQPVYLQWIKHAGHFWPHEKEQETTAVIDAFVTAAISGATYVPTSSECARSNGNMYDPGQQYCSSATSLATCQSSGLFSYATVANCNVVDQGAPVATRNPVLPSTTVTVEKQVCPDKIGTVTGGKSM